MVCRARAASIGAAAAIFLSTPVATLGADTPDEPPIMVVDLHVDIPYQVHFRGRSPALTEGNVYPAVAQAGGYGGLVFSIYMRPVHKDGAHIDDAEAILATVEKVVEKNPIFLPTDAKFAEPGRITSFLAIEGAGAFAKDITKIDSFISRGVRLIGPVHGKNSGLASSATDKKVDYGLTDVGKAFCERVYTLGALIDVSHLSEKGFEDLVPIAEAHGAPIVATHSNARALADHARNLSDRQLQAIGQSGGVVGVNFHSPYVTKKDSSTIDDVVAQVEYMVRVAGVEHVAIGTDYDGDITPPEGLGNASGLPRLAARLRNRGMTREDVVKIFSMNALRVLGWRPSKPQELTHPIPPSP